MPLDHFHDIGRTTHVTFALKRHTAKGPALGTWVTITGGPGTAGIYSAVSYTDSFDPEIRKHYDLVFMDQRGSGMSDSFTCPNAALALYVNPAGPSDPDGGVALKGGREGLRGRLPGGVEGRSDGAAVLRHEAGRRGPGGVPALARREAR